MASKRIRKGDEQLDQNGFRQDGNWPEKEFCFGQNKSKNMSLSKNFQFSRKTYLKNEPFGDI